MTVAKSKTTKVDAIAAARKVTAKVRPQPDAPALGDHPDTLGIIDRAMNSAARMVVDENDRLGIPTPGTDKDGKIVYRRLPMERGRTVDTALGLDRPVRKLKHKLTRNPS